MEIIRQFIDIFLHLDKHLVEIVAHYGTWVYAILFLIIFLETGIVITPFLPGDSLLFAAGAIAAVGGMNIYIMVGLLCIAAILGDTTNYGIGKFLGKKVFEKNYKLINKNYLYKAQAFYDKHGGKTIIIARFVPIVRTFAPFVAGVGTMNYGRFITFNIAGGIAWVLICSFAGYFFGNIEFVKKNFSIVVLAIIVISLIPVFIEIIKGIRKK